MHLLVLFSLLLLACGGSPEFLKYRSSSTPSSADYPGLDAVVLEDYTKADFFWHEDGYGYFKILKREVIKVFSHPEKYSNRFIWLGKGDKLERIDGYVLAPDGSVQKLDQGHIFDQYGSIGDGILHSDAHLKKLTFPGVVPGSILYLQTKLITEAGLAFRDWEVQREIPVREAKYILNAPLTLFTSKKEGGNGWQWRYVTYNGGEKDPVQTSIRGTVFTYDWTFRDLPPLKIEPFMPAKEYFAVKVAFAPPDFTTWKELGDLYLDRYFNPNFKVSPMIRQLADSLRTKYPQPKAFLKAAFELVSELRYVALNIGTSGLVPDAPEVVYRNRYGDCKGKTALLLALVQCIGLPAWPALVLTRSAGAPDPDFVSFHFNHMIAAVQLSPQDTLWLDPTDAFSPLGRLNSECAGREALLLSHGGSRLLHTPEYTSRDNTINAVTRVAIAKKLDTANYACSIHLTGEPRRKALEKIRDESDAASVLATSFLYSNALGSYLKSPVLRRMGDTLELQFQVRYPLDPNNVQFPESPLSLLALDHFISIPNRHYPLDLDYPFEVAEEVSMSLPAEWKTPIPEAFEKDNQILTMSRTPAPAGSDAWLQKHFSLHSELVSPEDYLVLRSDLETWQRKNTRFISLPSVPGAHKR